MTHMMMPVSGRYDAGAASTALGPQVSQMHAHGLAAQSRDATWHMVHRAQLSTQHPHLAGAVQLPPGQAGGVAQPGAPVWVRH